MSFIFNLSEATHSFSMAIFFSVFISIIQYLLVSKCAFVVKKTVVLMTRGLYSPYIFIQVIYLFKSFSFIFLLCYLFISSPEPKAHR